MDLGIQGRVALVAASSKGIGRAIAEELAAEGASLVICARQEGPLEAARAAIAAKYGISVRAIRADLSRTADVEMLVRTTLVERGRVDILVTNCGGPPAGAFDKLPAKAWEDTYHLTLGSVVNLVRGVLPGMKERRWGRIINITSIAVKQPVDKLILSNSFRAAVTGFARSIANEVAPFGITVNNVMPGYTRTERVDELAETLARSSGRFMSVEVRERWEKEIPMARLADPREVAALVTFLASDRASYVTAQSVAADGGWIRSLL